MQQVQRKLTLALEYDRSSYLEQLSQTRDTNKLFKFFRNFKSESSMPSKLCYEDKFLCDCFFSYWILHLSKICNKAYDCDYSAFIEFCDLEKQRNKLELFVLRPPRYQKSRTSFFFRKRIVNN